MSGTGEGREGGRGAERCNWVGTWQVGGKEEMSTAHDIGESYSTAKC